MVTILALALLQVNVPQPSGNAGFVEGRVDCHMVNVAGDAIEVSFDLAAHRVIVREGAGFVRNGAEFEAVMQDVSGVLTMRQRWWWFSDESGTTPVQFDLLQMVDDGYRAIRLAVSTKTAVHMGHGHSPMQQRLAAIGMCEPASQQEGSQVRS